MSAIVLWKPVEKALTVLAKRPTYQTFLNKFSNSVGKTVTANNVKSYVQTEMAASAARAMAVKGALLGAALGVAGDATYEVVKSNLLSSASDEKERAFLENVAGGESVGSVANAIAETLDDTPGTVRGFRNELVEAAVKTVEESMQIASILINFTGSVTSAKMLLAAIRRADDADFAIYERLRGY